MTEINPEHIAPCGLYCGVCRIHHATQENDLAYLERLVKIYARRFPGIAAVPSDELRRTNPHLAGPNNRMNPTGPIGPRRIGAFAFVVDLIAE